MRKIFNISILIVSFCAVVLTMVCFPVSGIVEASGQEVKYSILDANVGSTLESLTNYGIDESILNANTPYDSSAMTKMAGRSIAPPISGQDGYKITNFNLNITHKMEAADLTGVNVNNLVLNVWVNFNKRQTDLSRGIKIELSSSDGISKLTWTLDIVTLENLLYREQISNYDKLVFGSKELVKMGWCRLELPVSSAQKIGEIVKNNKFVFTNLNIMQTDNHIPGNEPLLLYDIFFVNNAAITEITVTVQDFANIVVDSNAVVVNPNKYYYKGEYYEDTLSVSQVFDACYIGGIDYLNTGNSNLLIVEAVPDTVGDTKTFAYGSGSFKIEQDSYKIKYCIKFNGKNISIISGTLNASSYGKGIWIEPISKTITKGSTFELKYDFHQAFRGDFISFESSDEEIFTIKSVDYLTKTIVIEALKVGDAKVIAKINDDRLSGTDYEETGIINDTFTVSVKKEIKTNNTTKILLWVGLSVIVAGFLAYGVHEIIKGRKLEVK